MRRTITLRATFSALLLAAAGAGPVCAQDYGASLAASPERHLGPCPAVIRFSGTITARKAGKVQYKFVRSDGASAPVLTLDFAAPGTKPVSTVWSLGDPTLSRYTGWQAIQIVYPVAVASARASFTIECQTAPAGPRPSPRGSR